MSGVPFMRQSPVVTGVMNRDRVAVLPELAA